MRILFIGDLFGVDTLKTLEKRIQEFKKEYKVNLVIVNGENINDGRGIKKSHYTKLMQMGVSVITMGNHCFSDKEIYEFIDDSNIIRPANYDSDIGKSYMCLNYNNIKIAVINLLGRTGMNNTNLDCPFKTLDKILSQIDADFIIVDFHAEATSEKIALGLDFDGKVDAVLGTHTHVQTADERVLPNGTLFISDVGMTGPKYGVIGHDAKSIIYRFRSGIYKPAYTQKGDKILSAVVLDLNPNKNHSIERILIDL